jgi:predicted RNA-binding Zn ribbon-like protein
MVRSEEDASMLKLIGGHLALDFSNSVWRRGSSCPCEILESYSCLVDWSRIAGAVSDEQARVLQKEGKRRAAEAACVLERAVTLRGAIYDIFSAIAAARTPDPRALATLNLELSSALCRRQVVGGPTDFAWAWRGCESSLDPMIWPIAVSASELLTSKDLRWVRECEAGDCDRLFLDTSRTRRRRWCSMEWCGNREKARRSVRQSSGA